MVTAAWSGSTLPPIAAFVRTPWLGQNARAGVGKVLCTFAHLAPLCYASNPTTGFTFHLTQKLRVPSKSFTVGAQLCFLTTALVFVSPTLHALLSQTLNLTRKLFNWLHLEDLLLLWVCDFPPALAARLVVI